MVKKKLKHGGRKEISLLFGFRVREGVPFSRNLKSCHLQELFPQSFNLNYLVEYFFTQVVILQPTRLQKELLQVRFSRYFRTATSKTMKKLNKKNLKPKEAFHNKLV